MDPLKISTNFDNHNLDASIYWLIAAPKLLIIEAASPGLDTLKTCRGVLLETGLTLTFVLAKGTDLDSGFFSVFGAVSAGLSDSEALKDSSIDSVKDCSASSISFSGFFSFVISAGADPE